ncbi:MAG: PadR family transcriptional regulator [Candidatus Saccharibacteria bacterium]
MNTVADKFGPLRKGLLELVVLRVVAKHQVYAADILAALQKTDFATGEGTLYPLLSRLRRDKRVEYEWVESEAGPPRKYYSLTDTGKKHLQELNTYWEHLHTSIEKIGSTK